MSKISKSLANALALVLASSSVTAGVIGGGVGLPGIPTIRSLEMQALAKPDSLQNNTFASNGNGTADPRIYGKTYAEWTAEWWKWALSFPIDSNPITDKTGEFCDKGQSGPVWFLAGTLGESLERTCKIPAGKAIFYPLINIVWIDCPESTDEDLTDDEVGWILANFQPPGDSACQLTSTLDTFLAPNFGDEFDMPLSALRKPAIRTQSPVFSAYLPENSLMSEACPQPDYPVPMPSGNTGRAVSEGHWVMLPPLENGEHLLKLHGAGCGPDGEILFENAVTYHLTIKP